IASKRRIRTSNSRSREFSSESSPSSCSRTIRSMRRVKPASTAPLEGKASRKSARETPAALEMSRTEMSSKRRSAASSIRASTILPRASVGGDFASFFGLVAIAFLRVIFPYKRSAARRQGSWLARHLLGAGAGSSGSPNHEILESLCVLEYGEGGGGGAAR